MTREEAIKFLTLMRKAVSNFEEYGHDKASMVIECDKAEAIDIAIEALSADRPTHERDLISRHEALMELNGACEMWEDDAIVADIIYKLPSIEIVRCKNCKWYKKIVEKSKSGLCHYDLVARCLHDEDFCSHGERKQDD